jgi:regulator of RNase E activity RraA
MTDAERAAILERCTGLRSTDVNDGMDHCGLQDVGMVSYDITPLWRNVETMGHRFYGFAHTVRFMPTNKRAKTMTPEEYAKFLGEWYGKLARGPIGDEIRRGDAIVIDGHETETGFIGSNNAQNWINRGATGVVTNGACRDSDELILQKIPVYCRYTRPTVRPARCELDATNVPVNIGGVMVRPGDLVVADGDGVIVVPVDAIDCVLREARRIANGDRAGRRRLYEQAGMSQDGTTEELA